MIFLYDVRRYVPGLWGVKPSVSDSGIPRVGLKNRHCAIYGPMKPGKHVKIWKIDCGYICTWPIFQRGKSTLCGAYYNRHIKDSWTLVFLWLSIPVDDLQRVCQAQCKPIYTK